MALDGATRLDYSSIGAVGGAEGVAKAELASGSPASFGYKDGRRREAPRSMHAFDSVFKDMNVQICFCLKDVNM